MKDPRICLVLALAYFVTGRLGLMLPAFGSHITLIWLPTGIAVAALLRWSFGCWPGIALGAFAVNVTTGTPWPVDLGISVGNTLAPLLSAWALRRMRFHPAFDRSRDILLLAAGATLGMLVSSGLGIGILSGVGMVPPGARLQAWLTWWGGDALGVIAAAPLVLTFTLAEMRAILRRRLEFAIWSVATGLATWAVFGANRGEPGQALAIAFTPLPFVAWAALRFGPVGTSLALIVLSVGAAYGTATQGGPFYRADPILEMELLWIFMATSAALGWLISALHTAHDKTTETQQLFEQALTDVSLGVLLAGLDRRITYANQGFTRLTGYTEAELLGKSCSLLHGPESDPTTVEKLKTALDGDGFFDGEILNYRKDGTTFWNGLLISPVHDESGVKTGFLGIQHNVTERKQAVMALRQSEEHLRTIIELEPECVKLVSPDGKLLEMNPAGLAMIDAASLNEVRGCALTELIVPEDRAAFSDLHTHAMQGGTGRCEFAVVSLKGTRRWLETHAVPYRNARREIVGVLGITRDITERKQHESLTGGQKQVLEMIASGERLPAILTALLRFIEAQSPEMLCSVLLLDPDGNHLHHGAAPGLPEAFVRGIEGLRIGPCAGSCGTAVFRREAVLVEDIATDPLWAEYRASALSHGLHACWSAPIFDAQRNVLGAFAIYFRQPGRPTLLHLDYIDLATNLAGIAISRTRAESTLQMMRFGVDHAGDGVFWVSPEGRVLYANESARTRLGYSGDEILGMTIFDLDPDYQPGVWSPHWEHLKEAGTLTFETRHRCKDGRILSVEVNANFVKVDGNEFNCAFVRDITTRKITEAALRDSEERLRLALGAANQGLYDLDIPTGEAQVSAEYATMLGYDPDDFRETNARWIERLHPDDRERMAATFQAYAEGRIPMYQVEFRQRTAGGKWKCILSQGKIVERDVQGRPQRMLGTHTDITQRKQAEETLRHSQDRLAAIINSLDGVVWEADANTFRCTFASPMAERMLGYPIARWTEEPTFWVDHIHPDDREDVVNKCMETMQQNRDHEFEYRMVAADGRTVWVRDSFTQVFENGRATKLRGIMLDITARKAAEEERQRTLSTLQLFIDSAPGYVSFVDADQRYQLVNSRYEEWFGKKRTEIVGHRLAEMHPAEAYEDMRPFVEQALAGTAIRYERCVPALDGTPHWFDIRYTPRTEKNGVAAGFFALVFDITERKSAESALQERERSYATLLKNLAGMVYRCNNDPDWTTTFISDGCIAVTGYRPEDLIGNRKVSLGALIHPDDAGPVWEKCQAGLAARRPCSNEYRIRTASGTERWVWDQAQGVYAETGELLFIEGYMTDITVRKRAEVALRESEEKFGKAFRNSPDAVLITTLEGRILDANAGFTRLTGYTFEEVHGRTTVDLRFWANATDRQRFISELQERGRVLELEAAFHTRTDELRTCLISGELMELDGKPAIVGVVRDISARKAAEAREAKQTARLKHLSELSLMLSGDPAAVFERVVRLIGELFDVRVVCLSEIVGKDLDFRAVYVDGEVVSNAGGCPLEVTPCATVEQSKDIRVFDRVAERFPQATFLRDHKAYAYCGFPVLDHESRVVAVTCLLDDKPHEFTEEEQHFLRIIGQRLATEIERGNVLVQRKQAEEVLRERDERLRAALSASGTGTFRWDIRTNEVNWDEALDALFRMPDGQTVRSLDNFIAAVHPDDRPGVIERCERCAKEGADFAMEFRVVWPDGSLHWLDDRGKTFFDDTGKPLYMTGACVDITERKQTEATVRELGRRLLRAEDKERRRIAKELHDSTAQDLVAVMMNLGTLRDALGGTSGQVLDDSIALVENSVNDIRTLSYVLHPPRLDEMGLPGALTEYAAGLATRADIRIRVEVAPDFGRLPEEMELALFRVAQESLGNAVRHSQSDAVTIRLARTDGRIVFEIEDYGRGMPSDERAIPGPYGVGIAGMRERLQQLGGNLEIESDDRGTIVRAVMPSKEQTE